MIVEFKDSREMVRKFPFPRKKNISILSVVKHYQAARSDNKAAEDFVKNVC